MIARCIAQAEQILCLFEAIEGHPATDYREVDKWSARHLGGRGRVPVLPGGQTDR